MSLCPGDASAHPCAYEEGHDGEHMPLGTVEALVNDSRLAHLRGALSEKTRMAKAIAETFGAHTAPVQWEYRSAILDEGAWNHVGQHGWELVAVTTARVSEGAPAIGYFKRRRVAP